MFNITITLSQNDKKPMYEQLYQYFIDEIKSGRLAAGTKLPSKRSLCAHLGVSRSTVENAYGLLVAEGYVSSSARRGYFIDEYTRSDVSSTPLSHFSNTSIFAESPRLVDFSTSKVDTSIFPYASWAKLNREVVYTSPELLQRGERQGEISLRKALSVFLNEYRGVQCREEQIVIGAGMEYLTELLIQLFPASTVFALEDPGYTATYHSLRNNNREIRFVPVDQNGMVTSALALSDASIAYVTPSHQFPMGVTMPASRRSQLLHWASLAPNRYIIEDDYDSEFRYSSRPIPAMQGMDGGRNVIYIGTFSRSLAPSIRIAYMVLPYELLSLHHHMFGAFSSTVSRYEQTVMARFISDGYYTRYLRRVGNLYKQRCFRLKELLYQNFPNIQINGSDGGLHFLLTLPNQAESTLWKRATANGIYIHKLSEYCHDCIPMQGTLVMGYGGIEDSALENAVALLQEALYNHT